MELNQMFKEGLWNKEINVSDFVHENILLTKVMLLSW